MSEPIPREFLLRLYAKHDELARVITEIALNVAYLRGPAAINALNRADRLADEMERIFAEVLTGEERGLTEDA